MLRAVADPTLDQILSGVSRSFYLSLAVLPRSVRAEVSVAYLVARAADTIADTRVIRAERRQTLLAALRGAIGTGPPGPEAGRVAADVARESAASLAASPDERRLLDRLPECLAALGRFEASDGQRTRAVLSTLLKGMERDLERFPEDGRLRALETLEELDDYTYLAAGCVGEYWTLMTAAHVPALERLRRPDLLARGVRLGKALQMVNVIRDAAADLRLGRCYWPRQLLGRHGLTPEMLADATQRRKAAPAIDELITLALAHVDAAYPYVLAIPRSQARLRLSALWPLWIGLGTLERLRRSFDPLDPAAPVKIVRGEVYGIVAESMMAVRSDALLERLHRRRRARAS